jgi:hypothetical protein
MLPFRPPPQHPSRLPNAVVGPTLLLYKQRGSHDTIAARRPEAGAGRAVPPERARAAPATPARAGRLDRRRDLDFLRSCPGVTGDFWDNEATTSGAAPMAPGEYLLSAN